MILNTAVVLLQPHQF